MNRDILNIINRYIINYKHQNVLTELLYKTRKIKYAINEFNVYYVYDNEVKIKFNKWTDWYLGFSWITGNDDDYNI